MRVNNKKVNVSVPLPGLLFLNGKMEIMTDKQMEGFRPLIGVIISKWIVKEMRESDKAVSVPLSGLLFLNTSGKMQAWEIFTVSVPLSGLLFLNQPSRGGTAATGATFPSPYRGYYF